MNSKGVAYLKWSIRELHPDADIDQDAVRVPLESYRLAIMSRNLAGSLFGGILSVFAILFGTYTMGIGTLQRIVGGAVFVLIGAVGLFFSLRMFDHVTDLMNKGETLRSVIRKIHAMGRMKW